MPNDIDVKIESLGDWRGERLARLRQLIKEAIPGVTEEIKWRKPTNPLGVPTWSHDGIICTGESYGDKVKLTFPKGSRLADPQGLFNASLNGVRRAIDIHERESPEEEALQQLFREAARLNTADRER